MSRQVRKAKRFVRGRRFLIAAAITMIVVGVGLAVGERPGSEPGGSHRRTHAHHTRDQHGPHHTSPAVDPLARLNRARIGAQSVLLEETEVRQRRQPGHQGQ